VSPRTGRRQGIKWQSTIARNHTTVIALGEVDWYVMIEQKAQLGFFLGNLSSADRRTFEDFLRRHPLVAIVPNQSSNIVRLNVRGTEIDRDAIKLACNALPSARKSTTQ
jgi:hypothetical protein